MRWRGRVLEEEERCGRKASVRERPVLKEGKWTGRRLTGTTGVDLSEEDLLEFVVHRQDTSTGNTTENWWKMNRKAKSVQNSSKSMLEGNLANRRMLAPVWRALCQYLG